ncbi:hypothetical protein [Streptomyces sp. NPDC102360]|uniref:hypothetical protein n=1 Tax=Streptomyces sp. NPDC102360 TaxID=3366160 RepID=UPI003810D808
MTSPPKARQKTPLGQRNGLGFVFILIFVPLALWFGFQALSSWGHFGTHGTFTVQKCEQTRSHTSSSRGPSSVRATCTGAFRSDDRSYTDDTAQVTIGKDDAPSKDGDAYVARLLGSDVSNLELTAQHFDSGFFAHAITGDYELDNTTRAAQSAGMVSGGFIFLGMGIFCLVADWPKRGGPKVKEAWHDVLGTPSRVAVIVFTSIGVVGFIASVVAM